MGCMLRDAYSEHLYVFYMGGWVSALTKVRLVSCQCMRLEYYG